MTTKPIYLCLAHMGGREQDFIQEAFDTNWVVPLGPNVNGFEGDLKDFLGGEKEVVALSAGTAAIHLALVQLGVSAGDEVICQSFTFCASCNPICYLGASPVFVDSESSTWNMSPALLEQAIEDRIAKVGKAPKAIVVVHLYGMPAQMDEILAVADRYNIPVVEDAAEAMGSVYKGKQCGTLGRFGVLSFNGNKMITTSGGGALICSSVEERQQAMFYATQAREPFAYYQHEKIGFNYRMSNICAGIGRGQMLIAAEHVAHHRMVHELYVKAFSAVDGIEVLSNPTADFDSNFWLSTILLPVGTCIDDCVTLADKLKEHGVEVRPLWKPMHLQPIFEGAPAYVDGTAESLFHRGLCLPSGPCVTEEDAALVVSLILELM
ncbi:MAG: aminotransferase class V-fold PLP-dependent enzyme [Rikenellaceae bacterium]